MEKMIGKIAFIFCIWFVEWIAKSYAVFYFILLFYFIQVSRSFISFMNIKWGD